MERRTASGCLSTSSGDDGLAAVGPQQGGQAADGGGLARAVRPEQAQDGALGDFEVDAVQCPDVPEGLDQTFGIDGAWHMSLHVVVILRKALGSRAVVC
ncbi:hypothetical protein GCM10023238_35180 [Streptomyces heliomycini]